MRNLLIVVSTTLLLALPAPAISQVNFALNISSGAIGFNISTYPQLVPIPGYPVYYAPRVGSVEGFRRRSRG
jgi:hypothetical protein